MSAEANKQFVLILQCPDTRGIVAAVSGFLADQGASITESSHFNDPLANHFYMRTAFRHDGPRRLPLEILLKGFEAIADRFEMLWELHDTSIKPRLLILVSKQGHCLFDLLHRWRAGRLSAEIPMVASNHEDMRSFVEWNAISFRHLPVSEETKPEQEAKILGLVSELKIDLVVLARYMQVLSPELCRQLSGRCINIHHSFLPGFKGARPYHQAYQRGVKIIGATAHYVTSDLDEGPIIDQGVQPVDHAHTPDELSEIGKDIECNVLARAVRWHLERRVLIQGQKTIVFK